MRAWPGRVFFSKVLQEVCAPAPELRWVDKNGLARGGWTKREKADRGLAGGQNGHCFTFFFLFLFPCGFSCVDMDLGMAPQENGHETTPQRFESVFDSPRPWWCVRHWRPADPDDPPCGWLKFQNRPGDLPY